MKRRESLKALLIGGLAGTATVTTLGCKPEAIVEEETIVSDKRKGYGRTPSELEHDKKVNEEIFLTEKELTTIAILCDIILPATTTAGSATDAKVPEFIDFIVKDLPMHQLPIRGGLMWLDGESNSRYGKEFDQCTDEEQIAIVDDIAYPDVEKKNPSIAPGISFFNRMRSLTLTGYYTSKMGIDDLGYAGNRPNVWDGVPQDVLDKHGMAYDQEWMPKFVDQYSRDEQAEWDGDGNLLN
ncbi:MAG: gluconate 2-dehydrogenase subunit 3 family protein [Bacteroidota bacterium]